MTYEEQAREALRDGTGSADTAQVYATLAVAESVDRLTDFMGRYIKFALGQAARAMRATGQDLPDDLQAIVDDLERFQ